VTVRQDFARIGTCAAIFAGNRGDDSVAGWSVSLPTIGRNRTLVFPQAAFYSRPALFAHARSLTRCTFVVKYGRRGVVRARLNLVVVSTLFSLSSFFFLSPPRTCILSDLKRPKRSVTGITPRSM